MFICKNNSIDSEDLEARARATLERRLEGSTDYTADEIERVHTLKPNLFPQHFELSTAYADHFRALAKLSQQTLKPNGKISSHRKYIGPVIVFLKKLSWPLIRIHLKDHFQGIEDFCQWSLSLAGKQAQEISELKVRLAELESKQ